MKKTLIILMLAIVFASCSRIDAGYVGVKVNLLGSNKGVQEKVLGVGRYYIGINEELYKFPTFQVNYVYTKDPTEGSKENEEFSFQTAEGMECQADIGISMHFEENQIKDMFQKYRKGVDEIRAVVVKNEIRDALNRIGGKMAIESVYGAGKGALIDSVMLSARKDLGPTGIKIDKIFLIGSIRIPSTVKQALDAKVTMTQEAQRTENEVAKAKAQANISIATAEGAAQAKKINADAEAYYNKTVSASLTPALIESQRIAKWNGLYPTTYGLNGGLLIK